MRYQRGDVVLVDIPFSSGKGSKIRPAVIVQCDHNNHRLTNTIIVSISTTTFRATREPAQLLIDPDTPEGRASGLLALSAVTCENVATIPRRKILRVIGTLPLETMLRVDVCLKVSLGII